MKQPAKKENSQQIWILVLFFLLLLPSHSAWAETYTEAGDAGDSLATAQGLPGSNPLTEINGNIDFFIGSDVDTYVFTINNPAGFSLSFQSAFSFDSQFFLFDSTGLGVLHNDDSPNGGVQSEFRLGDFTGVAGIYYLAISAYNNDALSSGGQIFPDGVLFFATENGPTGPGGGSALSGWTGGGFGGDYSLALTGASTGVPEIPTGIVPFVLMGLSFLGFRLKTFLKK